MARRRRRFRNYSGGGSRRRMYSNRTGRSGGGYRSSGRRGRRAFGPREIRIVVEAPGSNPVSRPGIPGLIGASQTEPKKARF